MRKNRIGLGIMLVVLVSFSLVGGPARKESRTQRFMRPKLAYSQGILEGIVLEKYDLVISNATLLRGMNLTNAFLMMGNPDYLEDINTFQGKVDGLVKAANEKNLKNSTEAYSQMVGSCINCHQEFRREQFQKHGFTK